MMLCVTAGTDSLVINEIYLSLQGESTWAGLPCIFVRLTACNLRCSYCDTAYAFKEGRPWSFHEIELEIDRLTTPYNRSISPKAPSGQGFASSAEGIPASSNQMDQQPLPINPGCAVPLSLPLIEFTGGEPLLQPRSANLMKRLCDKGRVVLLETSGAHDVTRLDHRIHRIIDVKCPSSGESHRNRWDNLVDLRNTDELKFVLGTWEDYAWAKEILEKYSLVGRCPILFSWVSPLLDRQRDPSLKVVPSDHRAMTRLELVEAVVRDALPVRFQLQMHKFIWTPEQRGV
jgi:7-carboxy-7-deazaguanine synthase